MSYIQYLGERDVITEIPFVFKRRTVSSQPTLLISYPNVLDEIISLFQVYPSGSENSPKFEDYYVTRLLNQAEKDFLKDANNTAISVENKLPLAQGLYPADQYLTPTAADAKYELKGAGTGAKGDDGESGFSHIIIYKKVLRATAIGGRPSVGSINTDGNAGGLPSGWSQTLPDADPDTEYIYASNWHGRIGDARINNPTFSLPQRWTGTVGATGPAGSGGGGSTVSFATAQEVLDREGQGVVVASRLPHNAYLTAGKRKYVYFSDLIELGSDTIVLALLDGVSIRDLYSPSGSDESKRNLYINRTLEVVFFNSNDPNEIPFHTVEVELSVAASSIRVLRASLIQSRHPNNTDIKYKLGRSTDRFLSGISFGDSNPSSSHYVRVFDVKVPGGEVVPDLADFLEFRNPTTSETTSLGRLLERELINQLPYSSSSTDLSNYYRKTESDGRYPEKSDLNFLNVYIWHPGGSAEKVVSPITTWSILNEWKGPRRIVIQGYIDGFNLIDPDNADDATKNQFLGLNIQGNIVRSKNNAIVPGFDYVTNGHFQFSRIFTGTQGERQLANIVNNLSSQNNTIGIELSTTVSDPLIVRLPWDSSGTTTLPPSDPSIEARKIRGVLEDRNIPNLDASKITSGKFSNLRIPNISANKIIDGVLGTARIPEISESKLSSAVRNKLNARPSSPEPRVLSLGVASNQIVNRNASTRTPLVYTARGSAISATGLESLDDTRGAITIANNRDLTFVVAGWYEILYRIRLQNTSNATTRLTFSLGLQTFGDSRNIIQGSTATVNVGYLRGQSNTDETTIEGSFLHKATARQNLQFFIVRGTEGTTSSNTNIVQLGTRIDIIKL